MIDSVREAKVARKNGFAMLYKAQQCWDGMSRFRRARARNLRYTYGNQWSDTITIKGETMTEEQYLLKRGQMPLKNNLIRRLVRNVLGVYRQQSKEPICVARDRDEQHLGDTMSTVLQCNRQTNKMNELEARSMEEFLIGGLIAHRKSFGVRGGRLDCWTDFVDPDCFFVDSGMKDVRTWDCSMVGEIHDVSFEELCSHFAKSPEDYEMLRWEYQLAAQRDAVYGYYEEFGFSRPQSLDFLIPSSSSQCRVVEVWNKEQKERYHCLDYSNGDFYKIGIEDLPLVQAENARRMAQADASGLPRDKVRLIKAEYFIDDYWYYRFITPSGRILDEGETPYAHGEHPYVFRAYPFVNGEIHSFVEDVIDQQRYVNRLITMYDFIMRSSAKGVLLVPKNCIPDDMTPEDFAEAWSSYDDVIVYEPKPGVPAPQQVHANSTNIGIDAMLQMQLKFFEDISGVHGALQGRPGSSGMSGSLYAQQTQNATTSLLDLLDTFSGFVTDAAYKDVQNIQQFYDTPRVFNIAGRRAAPVEYNPEKIRNVSFDLHITESQSSAVYQQISNEFLMQLVEKGLIPLEHALEVGRFSFGDELLQRIQSAKELQAGMLSQLQGMPQPLPPAA